MGKPIYIYIFFFFFFWLHQVLLIAEECGIFPILRAVSLFWCLGFSLVVACELQSTQAQLLWCVGLAALQPMESQLPVQDLNPCPLGWKADFQPLDHTGSPWLGVSDIVLNFIFLHYVENETFFVNYQESSLCFHM